MSQYEEKSDIMQHLQIDDGFNNVLDYVLDDIDGLLMNHVPPNPALTPVLPPIPSQHAANHENNEEKTIQCIAAQMDHLQIQQHQKQMASLSLLPMYHNNNNNNNINIKNMNEQFVGSNNITPNTSYNSLASLDTVNTVNTVNTNSTHSSCTIYPLIDDNLYSYDVFNGCNTKIISFEAMDDNKLQLKDYVFISKDCTRRLGQYVVRENWGKEYGLLYKYLDYIFRCQAFKKQIIEINDKYLIFHSGLQRKTDNEFLYVLLVPNKKYVAQKWRVQFGNIKNSFLSKQELLSKFTESYVVNDYLPQRTKFCSSLHELLYDTTYPIEVNWEERLTTNKDRLCKVLGNLAFFDFSTKFMKLAELITAFDEALQQTQRIADLNPRLAVAQGFVDTKHCKYRMELLLPIVIEFPKYCGNYYTFALAISKSTDCKQRKYIAKSILTMDMAYANARLVGYVDSSWLFYGHNNNGKMNINDFFLQNNVNTLYQK